MARSRQRNERQGGRKELKFIQYRIYWEVREGPSSQVFRCGRWWRMDLMRGMRMDVRGRAQERELGRAQVRS